jgi:hypothetical protein
MAESRFASPSIAQSSGLDRPVARGLLAAGAAAAANLIIYVVARNVFDVSLVMPYEGPGSTPARLPAAMVAIISVVAAIAGAVLLWVLGRVTRRPLPIFQAITLLVLLISIAGPLTLDETETSTKVALLAMHVVAAAVTVGILTAPTRAGGSRQE